MENNETQKILEFLERFNKEIDGIKQEVKSLSSIQNSVQNNPVPLNELFAALAKAQGEMQVARADKIHGHYKGYRYSSLPELVKASRPALAKYGICVIQHVMSNANGQFVVRTIMGHSSGQSTQTIIYINPAKDDNALSSALSRYMRLAYKAMTGVVTEEDEE